MIRLNNTTRAFSVLLGWEDRQLLVEALNTAAARHESMARAQKFGRPHDEKAKRMRELRISIMRLESVGVQDLERLTAAQAAIFKENWKKQAADIEVTTS